MQKDGIKIKGYLGKWYVIGETYFKSQRVYLLEHETYGDEAACLIVDDKLNVVLDDVYNGFCDLDLL